MKQMPTLTIVFQIKSTFFIINSVQNKTNLLIKKKSPHIKTTFNCNYFIFVNCLILSCFNKLTIQLNARKTNKSNQTKLNVLVSKFKLLNKTKIC